MSHGRRVRLPQRSIPLELRAREPSRNMLEKRQELDEISTRHEDLAENLCVFLRHLEVWVIIIQHLDPIDCIHDSRAELATSGERDTDDSEKTRTGERA